MVFLHRKGAIYFKHEFSNLGEFGHHLAGYQGHDEESMRRLDYLKDHILPEFKHHLSNIDRHIDSDGGNLLRKMHHIIQEEVFFAKAYDVSRPLSDEFSKEMTDFHSLVFKIIRLYKALIHDVDELIEMVHNDSENVEALGRKKRDVLHSLDMIISKSTDLAKIIKKFMSEVSEEHEIVKKLLKKDEREVDDFHKNFRSWLEVVD